MQGRDFQNLLELHPGVQRTPGGGFHSVTSNGNRPDDNNFFIDGADDNDVYYGETVMNEAGISGTPASFLPLDAIQEFNTQESPSADYGVKPGLVMNIGIKSGTNDLHGSAYYFHRNAAFDARNYFNPAPQPTSALLMHEFGASLGGPIIKDKWFYFVNYEGIRDRVGNPGVTDSPVTESLAAQMGGIANSDGSPNSALYSVPDAIAYFNDPNNVAYCQASFDSSSACAVNPLSDQLRGLFLPNPGFTSSQTDPAAINFDFNNQNRGDNLVAKTDFTLSPHHLLSARFIYGNTNQTEEDAFPLRPEWLSTTSPITKVFGVALASNPTSAWSNEVRFSFNSFNEAIAPVDHTVNPTQYGLTTGVTDPRLFGFPRVTVGSEFDYMGGNSSWPLYTTPTTTYSFSDTASYTRGRHTIRFGGNFRFGDVGLFPRRQRTRTRRFSGTLSISERRREALAFSVRRPLPEGQPEIDGILRARRLEGNKKSHIQSWSAVRHNNPHQGFPQPAGKLCAELGQRVASGGSGAWFTVPDQLQQRVSASWRRVGRVRQREDRAALRIRNDFRAAVHSNFHVQWRRTEPQSQRHRLRGR